MERDKVLRVLAAHRDELAALGVKEISIFGSVARDEARLGSDVDVLVEHHAGTPLSFFRVCRLRYFLEEILGEKVDLITVGGLRPEIREEVMAEAIRAA
ncbi:MAG: nucleotidyltransferase family protein [Thermoleophilia bacterium]